jgi:hypothetical protein
MNMRSAVLSATVVATLAAALAGCQSAAVERTDSSAPPAAIGAEGLTDEQRAIADLAIKTLAADLDIPPDRIRVDAVSSVEWRNSSLGCPKPGIAYLDVITPGHKVILRADGQAYVVHEAGNRAFVCRQSKLSTNAPTGGIELAFGRQWQLAREDLAGRLQVPESEIRTAGVEPMTWPDASLGCPEPGMVYATVETEGWVVRLRHGDREFRYHADNERAIPCPAIAER